MEARKSFLSIVIALTIAIIGGCVLTDVLPEDPPTDYPTVEIVNPVNGIQVPGAGSLTIEVRGSVQNGTAGTYEVTANDSLVWRNNFSRTFSYTRNIGIYNYLRGRDELVVRANVVDRKGFAVTESVTVRLTPFMVTPPLLYLPHDGLVMRNYRGAKVRLEIEDYDDLEGNEEFEFQVANDSLFTQPTVRVGKYSYWDHSIYHEGEKFWRARVRSSLGPVSPWSEIRRIHVVADLNFTPDAAFFQTVDKVDAGPDGVFVFGGNGTEYGIMKRELDGARNWFSYISLQDPWGAPLEDGGYLAVGTRVPGSSGNQYACPTALSVDSEGQPGFDVELDIYSYGGAARVLEGGDLLWGLKRGSGADSMMTRSDSAGNILWRAVESRNCYDLIPGPTGSFVYLSGGTPPLSLGVVTADGTSPWYRHLSFAGGQLDGRPVLAANPDGSFLVGASIVIANSYVIRLWKMDDPSGIAWQLDIDQELGTSGSTYLGDIEPGPHGGYYLAGSGGNSSNDRNIILARLDDSGRVEWHRHFRSSGRCKGTALAVLEDRILLAGEELDYPRSAVLILTDLDGNILIP